MSAYWVILSHRFRVFNLWHRSDYLGCQRGFELLRFPGNGLIKGIFFPLAAPSGSRCVNYRGMDCYCFGGRHRRHRRAAVLAEQVGYRTILLRK